MKLFKLIENKNNQIVLKVTDLDNRTIAKNPFCDSTMDYITVTPGIQHGQYSYNTLMTVTHKNGTTDTTPVSVNIYPNRETYELELNIHTDTGISDIRGLLARKVIEFLWDKGIDLKAMLKNITII